METAREFLARRGNAKPKDFLKYLRARRGARIRSKKMKTGTFPQPVRIGKRRVAWRDSDIAA
jgi:hypothetical protein